MRSLWRARGRRHRKRRVPGRDRWPARPQRSTHAKALLVWLNKWGCRQFAIAHHPTAAHELGEWGSQWLPLLPKPGASLAKLKPRQLAVTADAYGNVKQRARESPPDEERRHCDRHRRRDGRGEDPPRAASEGAAAVGRADPRGARLRRVTRRLPHLPRRRPATRPRHRSGGRRSRDHETCHARSGDRDRACRR